MRLADQVCSLELAKRLKELGVKQKSVLYHGADGQITGNLTELRSPAYSAFTVAELGELIGHFNIPHMINGKWREHYSYDSQKTEAHARANTLIYLIENGLVKTPPASKTR